MDAVTLSLEAWLRRCLPAVELCLENQDQALSASGKSILWACLYDVREEEEQSRSGRMYVRDAVDSAVTTRLQPLRIFQYSYRLTASGANCLDRQRLLADVMRAGAATPCLPDDIVHASFSAFGPGALPLVVAPAAPVPFLGGVTTGLPPLPTLHLVVMAPLRPPADSPSEPAPKRVDLGTRRTDGRPGPLTRRSASRSHRRIEERGT